MAVPPSPDRDAAALDVLRRHAQHAAQQGRTAEARDLYLAILARVPADFGALNDLGNLLYAADFRAAARLTYAEAVKYHPDNPIGRINLANAIFADGQHDDARLHYEAALNLAPDHPDAHQGLANLLQDLGDSDAAERHRLASYRRRTITTLPYRGEEPPRRLLLLVSAVGGNVPTRFLLDDTVFAISVLAVEAHAPTAPLPPHDLVFNAVGDADLAPSALDVAEAILTRTGAPLINPPRRIRGTGRADIAAGLADLAGVRAPQVRLIERAEAPQAAAAFGYPLLVRSPGYHTGRNFLKIDTPAGLEAVAALPGRRLLLIEYLDARDSRGRARKFRAMMIAGRLYPLHLATSDDWKVHYFTADMLDRPAHRAEEAAFLEDMGAAVGDRAMGALQAINRRLGLDYGGIDFGLGPEGELLLFEANATMVVNPPDADPRWNYRRAPIDRILQAARAMLLERSAAAGSP